MPERTAAAIIQFTSGSTGRPKGVVSAHGPLADFLNWQTQEFGLTARDRVSLLSGLGHDPSLRDMFLPLALGATLVIPEQAVIDDGTVGVWLKNERVSVSHMTPGLARIAFSDTSIALDNLRHVFIGGDVVRPTDIAACQASSSAPGVVFYGATETPQAVFWHRCDAQTPEQASVPIGRPVPGVEAHILRPDGDQVRALETGELVIGGRQLSLGYLNPIDDEGAFIEDTKTGQRHYRTNDIVRLNSDETCSFVSRKDRQIKVHGNRVHPADVEQTLRSLPSVSDAVVVPVHEPTGETSLVSWIVTNDADSLASDCGVFFFGESSADRAADQYRFYQSIACHADASGLKAIWTPERHFTKVAGAFPNPAVLTASLASVTNQITLRAGSVVLPLHHPVRVAEDWAVIDALSGGRAEIALASGWLADDFIFAPDNFENRKAVLQRDIATLRGLWRGEAIGFENGCKQQVDIQIRPVPEGRGIPLWMTATADPETFRAAGRLGCHVLTALNNQNTAELRRNIQILRDEAAAHNHPRPKVALMLHGYAAESQEQARADVEPALRAYLRKHAGLRKQYFDQSEAHQDLTSADLERILDHAVDRMMEQGLIGSVEHCAEKLRMFGGWGVDEIAALVDFGPDQQQSMQSVSCLAQAAQQARDQGATTDVAQMRAELESLVPDYMVPSRFIPLDALPLTPNGKPDIDALRARALSEPAQDSYTPPATQDEHVLCDILAELFHRNRIGVEDDFFALGGYSLLALKAAARFEERTGRALPVASLLNGRTVRGTLALIGAAKEAQAVAKKSSETDSSEDWPLSPGQVSHLLANEMSAKPEALNVSALVTLKGPLDADLLLDCVRSTIDRHSMLQTLFLRKGEEVVQSLASQRDVSVADHIAPDAIDDAIQSFVQRPIDRFSEAPFRARLFRREDADHTLALVVHHTASDGVSLQIFLSELLQSYVACAAGQTPNLPAPSGDYAEFAAASRKAHTTEKARAATAIAVERLDGAEHLLEFAPAKTAAMAKSQDGASLQLDLDTELSDALQRFCAQNGSTPFAVFHAMYVLALAHYTNREDVLCGVATAGRPLPQHETTVGLFADLAVTRTRLDELSSVAELIRASSKAATDVLSGTPVRFEWLLDALRPKRTAGRHPLVQAVLSVQQDVMAPDLIGSGDIEIDLTIGENTNAVLFDLLLSATRLGAGWRLRLDYSNSVFTKADAEGFLSAILSLLTQALDTPEADIWSLPLVPASEQARLCGTLSGDTRPIEIALVHERVAEQVAVRPEKNAILWRNEKVSYSDLAARASAIRAGLLAEGVTSGRVVGIRMSRTPDMVATLLAVLQIGAAYLPIDPVLPLSRQDKIIALSDAVLVVTDQSSETEETLNAPARSVTQLIKCGKGTTPTAKDWPPSTTACVLFTSGSTGEPKGVLVPHAGIVRLVTDTNYIAITPDDALLHANNLSFDLSNFDIWGALINGATVVLADDASSKLISICDALEQHPVTIALLATGIFHALAEDAPEVFSNLTHLVVAGDVLSPERAQSIVDQHPALELINGYGPSECATFATAFSIRSGQTLPSPVPVGPPISNTRAYVLNRSLALVPHGAAGELFLGGIGVANGYLGRPDLTKERFVPSPFLTDDTLYRTGDIVRWREDGSGLEFLGRADHQIKIQGIRVETGEIASTLLRQSGVNEAIVLATGAADALGLAAFVVTDPDHEVTEDDLLRHLRQTLPHYMVPRTVICLKAMPLTTNGKVDRSALLTQLETSKPETAPDDRETIVERAIADVAGHLLKQPGIPVTANFFDLGANSLTSLRLLRQLRTLFGVTLPVATVFAHPTARLLAEYLIAHEPQVGRTEAVARAISKLKADKKQRETPHITADVVAPPNADKRTSFVAESGK
ncbi:MAG: amino acid adenylation domain-containing protein [Pseudomonadota bacterium]